MRCRCWLSHQEQCASLFFFFFFLIGHQKAWRSSSSWRRVEECINININIQALTHPLSTFFNILRLSLFLSLAIPRQSSKQRNPSLPTHHALSPPFHHNRHLRHHPHPHPPSPHNLNTDSIRHERNGRNKSSPRTIPPPPDIDHHS